MSPADWPASRIVQDALVVCPQAPDRIGGVYTSDGGFVASSGVRRGAGVGLDRVFGGELSQLPHPVATLEGDYVYLGGNFSHYGHVLLEGLARTWYLLSERTAPDTPLLVMPFPSDDLTLLRAFLELLGQQQRPVYIAEQPVRVERLHLPDVGIMIRGPGFSTHLNAMRRSVVGVLGAGPVSRSGAIYLSRAGLPGLRRKIIGEALLEDYLATSGVKIFRPETASLREQISILRGCDTVIGYVGSALHTLVFCEPGLRVLYLSATEPHETFPAIDRLMAFDGHYLVRGPETSFPGFRPKRPQNAPVLLPIFEIVDFLRRHGIVGTLPTIAYPELLAEFAVAWMDWAPTAGIDPRFAKSEHEDAQRRAENARAFLHAIARRPAAPHPPGPTNR